MKNIIGNPNNWHIEVIPKRAGDFGMCSVGSIQYDKEEAENLSKEMQEEIKRHVDSVRDTNMVYDNYICEGCGWTFADKKEAEICGCKNQNEH